MGNKSGDHARQGNSQTPCVLIKVRTRRGTCSLALSRWKMEFGRTRVNSMLTKYQMIKFIDFCEVWFLPESVASVAAIDGDHRSHTPRY
ncbi:hypothetical protein TNCV_4879781 [Trichonephila clavipes]|nr:hypothetical protein TNCV_4879781 [Trichonephila clavipes]